MLYALENEKIWVQVNDYGAELWSVYDKESKTERLWQGEASIWPRRAPIVFPICGELTGGKCVVDGAEYHMPMHGFARDFVHEMVEKTDTALRMRLTVDAKTRAMYPFDFQFDSVFTLHGNTLEHAFEIKNLGDCTMPFSVGYHTGYRSYHSANESMADYELQFDVAEPQLIAMNAARVANGEPSILSADGKTMQVVENLFTDTIILKDKQSHKVTFMNRKTGKGLEIGAAEFPSLLLWSIAGDMPYLCIEPWFGEKEADNNYGELSQKYGMQSLVAGESFRCAQTIAVL